MKVGSGFRWLRVRTSGRLLWTVYCNMKKLTEHSSSWQADISSASQISRILWNSKFHRRVHNSHHLFLSSTRFFQSLLSNPNALVSIEICSSHVHLGLPSGLFPSRFPPYASLFYPPPTRHMPHPCHPSWFDSITAIVFEMQCTVRSCVRIPLLHSFSKLTLWRLNYYF